MIRSAGVFTKLLAIICAFLLTGVPGSEMWAQANTFGQLPTTGWQTSKLSQAVVNDANQAAEILVLHSQTGKLTSSDLENAAASLQILFDHYQEIGLNAALQKQILNNQEAFLTFQMSDSQIATYQSRLASDGVNVSASRIQSAMNLNLDEKQQFLSVVEAAGLYRVELGVVAELRAQAQQLAASENSGVQSSRLSSTTKAHLVLVISKSCEACFLLAAIGLATACTATAPACGPAIGVCTVCALGG